MAQFTASEYTDMIITYGMAGENALAAKRLYAERFPERQHPLRRTILRNVQRLRETGSLLSNVRPGRAVHLHVRDEERILREFERNPGYSVRRAANTLGISKDVIHRTLQRNRLHPYHYQRVQQLLPGDLQSRVFFCEGISIIFI
ncbi:uncharacterized protein LOC113561863 [Ooceraea biroi]|uniref:uncharacterized protein LOC113561863 n=1 Tax=Ooceraea biroi TaxID=2015173 RepID=UPI000F088A0B|nr:uncharacterized protein LOC113561863 [Ooceraea biroi]